MSLREQLDMSRLPSHIAIIMDGNGRWAKEQGQDRLFGHFHGVESVRNIVEGAAELGIQYLTLYAFSTENWDRPVEEVTGLMELLVDSIKKETETLNKNNIRLHVIGDINMLPDYAKAELDECLRVLGTNTGLNVIMALSYSSRWEIVNAIKNIAADVKAGHSSRWEIVNAIKNIAADVKAGHLEPYEIDQDTIKDYLTTREFPDPELMIRTSGEYRISNFLLYQLAYAELYFTSVRWPDFRKDNLYEAILDYQKRERRFGKTGEQLHKQNETTS